MANERLANEMATMLAGLQEQIRETVDVHRRRAELTATASAHDGRVVVTVDADGILTDVTFSDKIDDLSDDEIALAVTTATQRAAQEAADSMREMVQPLLDRRARWPKLSDLLSGAIDLEENIPGASRAPTSAPDARRGTNPDADTPGAARSMRSGEDGDRFPGNGRQP
ncbi:YbaB/EbfC family nucleoid-associated protein [Nocardia sp. BMG51109]|uniref:YbaB/EbfC family nucleoid-associated protein n=1 Tax=Nocardia sp. BMG51109 TaxID=1056816 RepID=UPI0004652404|nr:YbaB/EbfC family nucleoid-associated protein [Nocardia sp. BMG51109]